MQPYEPGDVCMPPAVFPDDQAATISESSSLPLQLPQEDLDDVGEEVHIPHRH
jgi:hypothetical protein